jgi:ABC-type Fe3+-hydroxamate transport system substrate-binding protein
MLEVTDQMGSRLQVSKLPVRIISLVPSQTELLFDFGLDDEVVGITKFCVHPESWFKSKQRVGGTKQLNLDLIRSLNPDLIIGNKEENDREQIETLQKEFPVWMSDVITIDDALEMIKQVGVLVGREAAALQMASNISQQFKSVPKLGQQRTAYFIWKDPWMAVGNNTYISSILEQLGLQNVFIKAKERYPQIDLNQLQALKPELILLPHEPFPFKAHHVTELGKLFPRARIKCVDGEMFSWYGSRMALAPSYLSTFLSTL